MTGTTLLINLTGSIALLLWGTQMVSSALLRGFGSKLRLWLGQHLNNRWAALLSGIAITGVLQSSTAVSLMASSFTASGTLGLAPALAVMLGANIGSTLVVQLLNIDVSILTPLVLLVGVIVFRLRDDSRFESLGCALIGLGLMLLALRMLGATLSEVEGSPLFAALIGGLDGDLLIAVLAAALLTWMCHSSVAVMLLVASLAATGLLSSVTAMALVLGVNIGGALPSLLKADSSVARRLPLGNLLVRLCGAAVLLPCLPWLARSAPVAAIDASLQAVYLHSLFNLVLALLFIGLTEPMAKLLNRLLPEPPRGVDPGMPHYLDEAGLAMTNIGLANAAREALRLADMLSLMLDQVLRLFQASNPIGANEVHRGDQSLDLLSAAIRAYLADIGQDGMSDQDADRAQEILLFVINLEHAGDILSSSLTQLATRRLQRGEQFSVFELDCIEPLHQAVIDSLSLAITVFLREDRTNAQQLVNRKELVRRLEAEASREHFHSLRSDRMAWAESGDIFQRVLRDYRRVHHHIAALAYLTLERAGRRDLDNGELGEALRENPVSIKQTVPETKPCVS
ncbi:Na/Pi cotransporter family protein [Pseudomonas promysalinigenes]|uniref:Na/Pi cotransporter family protein n=1 Tax=Pseudomonas promysalinigenes TaxID=485898 RepID=UPI003FA0D5D3